MTCAEVELRTIQRSSNTRTWLVNRTVETPSQTVSDGRSSAKENTSGWKYPGRKCKVRYHRRPWYGRWPMGTWTKSITRGTGKCRVMRTFNLISVLGVAGYLEYRPLCQTIHDVDERTSYGRYRARREKENEEAESIEEVG